MKGFTCPLFILIFICILSVQPSSSHILNGHWALNTNGALILCQHTNGNTTCNGIYTRVTGWNITLVHQATEKGIYDGNNTINWGNHKWIRRDECTLGQWEEWSSCSKTCAGGTKSRAKIILTPPSNVCEFEKCKLENETVSCNEEIGCPVDCVPGQWEGWSSCSAKLDGLRKRKRGIWIQSAHGGSECSNLAESVRCSGTETYCRTQVSASCRATYDGESKYIQSPNYPSNYGNNEDCTWKLEVPHGNRLKLKTFSYKLEPANRCNNGQYDVLFIYDGANSRSTEIARLCETTGTQGDIVSSSNSLFLRFKTDRGSPHQGFKIFYEMVN